MQALASKLYFRGGGFGGLGGVGEEFVGLVGEVLKEHALDGNANNNAEDGGNRTEYSANLGNESKESGDDTRSHNEYKVDKKQSPFFPISGLVAHLEGLGRRYTTVDEEIKSEVPRDCYNDNREEHKCSRCTLTHPLEPNEQEEVSEVVKIGFVEDVGRIDNLPAPHFDDGFVQPDGGADIEVGNPHGDNVENYHKEEGKNVLHAILKPICEGLGELDFLCCHKTYFELGLNCAKAGTYIPPQPHKFSKILFLHKRVSPIKPIKLKGARPRYKSSTLQDLRNVAFVKSSYLWGVVKRIGPIILLIALLSACCSKRQPELLGAELASANISSDLQATIVMTISNPSQSLKIEDVQGNISKGGDTLILFTAEPFVIPKGDNNEVPVDVTLKAAPGVGKFTIARIVWSGACEDCSADVSFSVKGPLGIKHKEKIEGIPLRKLIR